MSFFSFSINDLLCQDQVDLKEEEEQTEVRSENRDAKVGVEFRAFSFQTMLVTARNFTSMIGLQ